MKKRKLGNTGIELSEVGYGAAALFGKDVLGKQGITEEQAYDLISTAIGKGVTFFDTGINYGYSEDRLGRCIQKATKNGIIKREDLVIETKCGETVNADGSYGPYNWSVDNLKNNLEISLKRLQLNYVDLLAMHGECDIKEVDGVIKTFESFKSQGLIKAYGVNTFNTEFVDWVVKEKCFDYVMLDYNVMKQDREPQIEKLYNAGIGVIAGASLGQSLYAKKLKLNRNDLWYTLRSMFRFKYMRQKSKDFRFLNDVAGFTANQLALRYVLDNEKITSAAFNTTSVEHLIENLKAVDMTMPDGMRARIKEVYIGEKL